MDPFSITVRNLEEVILFLAPGFIFVLLFFYQIPDRKKSQFTVIFISVFVSLLLNKFTIGLFQLVNWLTSLKVNLSPDGVGFWITMVLLSVLFSIASVKFVRSKYFRFLTKKLFNVNSSPFGRVWNDFFGVKEITVMRVYLQDDTCYIGKLDKASIDPNDEIQEITLLDPNYFEIKKGKPTVTRIKEVNTVLLQGNSIKSVEKINYKEAKKLYDLP